MSPSEVEAGPEGPGQWKSRHTPVSAKSVDKQQQTHFDKTPHILLRQRDVKLYTSLQATSGSSISPYNFPHVY